MADLRYSKRRKLHRPSSSTSTPQRGDDDYVPGNIIEIEIHNFMTYDHLTCRPASRLNLVIGPNGSGKSSLVCAIALGLAADPQILGRAASVGTFVKRGEESGYVKISLRGFTAGERIQIVRKIDTQNKSEWMLNGVAVPKRDVVEMIGKFNIQVNNLTQFLPQDRVCEFAKLTPIQLLEETEKSVGDPELPVQHRALVEKSRELNRLDVTVKQNRETLNQLKALNVEQEKDVERVRQRDNLVAKAELMKQKLPWLKYDLKKKEYKDAQKIEARAKKNLDDAARILSDLTAPIEEKKKTKAMLESGSKKTNNQITQNAKQRSEFVEMEAKMTVEVRAKYTEMDDLKRQEETRQQRIVKAEENLIAAEREFEELPIYEPPRDELERLRIRILELEMDAKQKRMQSTEYERLLYQKRTSLMNINNRLKEMENNTNKLLQALRKYGADRIFDAYKWLNDNRGQLRREVYGPVLLEVIVQNRAHAAYLEGHVNNYIWKAFITQDSADRDFLVRNLKSCDIPILNYVVDRGSSRVPFEISYKMHELGVTSRLDQVFEAPDAVKDVLISQANLDRAYIGSEETDRRADEVTRLGIMDLWTPQSHYRWSASKYGGHISATVDKVHPSRLFMSSPDVSDIEKLREQKIELENVIAELEESIKVLHAERRQLEDEAAKLHRERESIHRRNHYEKKKRREMENRVEQRKKKLESLNGEEDLNSVTGKLINQAVHLNEQRFHLAIKIKTLLIEAVAFKWSFAEKHMKSIEFDTKIREMEVETKKQEKTALNAATYYESCKKETVQRKQQLSAAKQIAESVAIITEDLAQEFLQMPDTVENLEAAIQDNISEANAILFLNQNVLEEYESRQRKINAMSVRVEADEKELDRCLSEINTLQGRWLPTLRNLVVKINETFSHNFQEMAVAGEVSLGNFINLTMENLINEN